MMMQEYLNREYCKLREKAIRLPSTLTEALDAPFLIHPNYDSSGGWSNAKTRVMLVGQEPYDWGFECNERGAKIWSMQDFIGNLDAVQKLTKEYFFHTYLGKQDFSKPFARARRYFSLPLQSEEISLVNTNLFRCAMNIPENQNGRSPIRFAGVERIEAIYEYQSGVLSAEISILQPDIVIFFTGPQYDRAIEREFKGVRMDGVGRYTQRQLSRVSHSCLPPRSYRTYHPGYLARGRWDWLKDLKSLAFQS